MTDDGLVNLVGNWPDTFPKLDPATIQHASEIMNDRRTIRDGNQKWRLRRKWFWTADSALYRVEDDEVVLYFGNRDTNLIFSNFEDAKSQFSTSGNYFPSPEDISRVVDSVEDGNTLRIKLSDLELEENGNIWNSFSFSTSEYESLNETQRAFAEMIYGRGDDFVQNMKMLNDEGISTTTVSVLNPNYVKQFVKQDGAIVRPTVLYELSVNSNFGADNNTYRPPEDCTLRGNLAA
jgi:hypothetical protein